MPKTATKTRLRTDPMTQYNKPNKYQSLKQKKESVKEITGMFTERVIFFIKYVASKVVYMCQYLIMLKPDIREFVVNT